MRDSEVFIFQNFALWPQKEITIINSKKMLKKEKNQQTFETTKLKRNKPFEGIGFNVEVHLQALCVQSF